jgi:hypothetical protein
MDCLLDNGLDRYHVDGVRFPDDFRPSDCVLLHQPLVTMIHTRFHLVQISCPRLLY